MKKLVLACIGTLLGLGTLMPLHAQQAEREAPVYIIPIKGQIERGLLYAIRRGINEANAQDARAIIIDMDTPGGRLDVTESIVLMLLDSDVPTYTFVNPRAISAGAIISFSTDAIYMTPSALIGDAMPIMMSPMPMGGAQAIPDDIKEKIVSPTVALIRASAQRKGHDPDVGEAMVRTEFELKRGDTTICEAGQLLTLTSEDATQLVGEPGEQKPLLATGIAKDLPELLEAVGLAGAKTVSVTVTTAERIARVLDSFPYSGILMALGLLGLYIEFKTPGFGVPGIAGMLLLALWFWGHHIAGLAGMMELIMFIVGALLLLLEIFVIPGFGVAGILGIMLMAGGLLLSMIESLPGRPIFAPPVWQVENMLLNSGTGLVLTFLAGALLARILPETAAFKRIMLNTAISSSEGYQASAETTALLGKRGETVSELRPAGIAVIDGNRQNVVSRGEFIDKGCPIVVAESHGNRIVVEKEEEGAA